MEWVPGQYRQLTSAKCLRRREPDHLVRRSSSASEDLRSRNGVSLGFRVVSSILNGHMRRGKPTFVRIVCDAGIGALIGPGKAHEAGRRGGPAAGDVQLVAPWVELSSGVGVGCVEGDDLWYIVSIFVTGRRTGMSCRTSWRTR